MDGEQKQKHALDETRMLVMGATVLLGFQTRGAFQPLFDGLSRGAKAAMCWPFSSW